MVTGRGVNTEEEADAEKNTQVEINEEVMMHIRLIALRSIERTQNCWRNNQHQSSGSLQSLVLSHRARPSKQATALLSPISRLKAVQ
jgi:hypothetical protein